MRSLPVVLGLVVLACAATALSDTNLVRNPSFELDTKRSGVPDEWQTSGDSRRVSQTFTLDRGRDGKRCVRLECTRYEAGSSSAHAMICQVGVPVRRGVNYRVALWARGEGIGSEIVSIALSDTSVWANCGLEDVMAVAPQWKRYEFIFRAVRECSQASRFQIWFNSTGTLWLDDVEFAEAGPDAYRPGQIIPAQGRANLIPNASFECGTDGWGSAEWDRTVHWGGPMNLLFGRLDEGQAYDGSFSLRIELSPDNQPVSYFDYYELYRRPIQAPLAANIGFLEVQPGRAYTLSVYMKAQSAGTPARLAVREFQGKSFDKGVTVSTDWQRYAMTFKPTARWCYVLAGPDLRKTRENPGAPDRATLWLDAAQLEQAQEPAAFTTRWPVEFGLSTDQPGNVFGWDEPLLFRLVLANSDQAADRPARVELRLTDFFDREVWREQFQLRVPAGSFLRRDVSLDARQALRGFLRLHARLVAGDVACQRTTRLAVIPVHPGGDSRFGVNHAYPWPHLLELCRKAGLVWVRDWSLKWQEVEPEKGRFTFVEPDYQIDRPLRHGLRVLGLLPFPSSDWSSGAPAGVAVTDRYPESRARVAYSPRDLAEFENYVQRTVAHYRGRITWWQVFNEPLYTSYSLPRKYGYDGATYAQLTKAFVRAARRADPQSRILAGIGGLHEGELMDDFQRFFASGGLEAVDAVDIHHYPRIRPPEFIEPLLEKLGALMDKHGPRKPIWLTEYGYYGEDEPWAVPLAHGNFDRPLESEQIQAAHAVRWATIMLAGGVEKVFYHAGTCGGINSGSIQGVFYEYAGQPHKVYAAQAVIARLLTPSCRFVNRLTLSEGSRAYLFRDGQRLVGVVWTTADTKAREIRLAHPKLQCWDIMGRTQASRSFTPTGTPVYLIADELSDAEFQQALK